MTSNDVYANPTRGLTGASSLFSIFGRPQPSLRCCSQDRMLLSGSELHLPNAGIR